MQNWKKIIPVFLAICLIVSMFSGVSTSFADTGTPQIQPLEQQPFFAEAQTSGNISVKLYPMENVNSGVPTLVTFGVPFTRGSLTPEGLSTVRVLKNGTEIPAYVEMQTPWRHMTDSSKDGRWVRIARIQIHYTFEVTYPDYEEITVEWGTNTRTQNVTTFENPRSAWHKVTSGSFVDEDNVYEPDVYAVLPKEVLSQGVLKVTRARPTSNEVGLTRDDPNVMAATEHYPDFLEYDYAQKNFFFSSINEDDPLVTPANSCPYKTDSEPWLYDRASSFFTYYFRSGSLKALREAVRNTQFYMNHIYRPDTPGVAQACVGLFDLKNPNPAASGGANSSMYSYNECFAYNYWLTGDDNMLDYINWIALAHDRNTFSTRWNPSMSMYTERHASIMFLAHTIAYEVTGSTTYRDKVLSYIDDYIWLQDGADGQIPANRVDGALYHLASQHLEGSPGYVASPWMSVLAADAMIRAYSQTEDIRIGRFIKRMAQWECNILRYDDDHGYDTYSGNLWYPPYMVTITGQPDPSDGYSAAEHAISIANLIAWGGYFANLIGEPNPALYQMAYNLYYTYDISVNYWTRPAGPSTGRQAFRINPWRKYNWEYRTSGSFSWLLTQPDEPMPASVTSTNPLPSIAPSPTPSDSPAATPSPSPKPVRPPKLMPSPNVLPSPSPSTGSNVYYVGAERTYKKLADIIAAKDAYGAPLVKPGDTILIDPGSYAASAATVISISGTESAPITIKGIKGPDGQRPALSIGPGGNVHTLDVTGSNIIIEGLDITSSGGRAIYIRNGNITIRDCVIHDCYYHGIQSSNVTGRVTLEYVELYNNGRSNNQPQIDITSTLLRIQHCYFHDAVYKDIETKSIRNEIYYNRIVSNTTGMYSMEFMGTSGSSYGHTEFVGNVVIKDANFHVTKIGSTAGMQAKYLFVNNVFIFKTGSFKGLFVVGNATGVDSAAFYNNAIYNTSGNSLPIVYNQSSYQGIIYGSNNWVSNLVEIPSNWANTIIGGDPGFADAEAYDFRLVTGSPLIDAGILPIPQVEGHEFPDPLEAPQYMPPGNALEDYGMAMPRGVEGSTIDIGAYELVLAPVWYGAQLEASDITGTSLTLSWPPADDPDGIANYAVYMDEVQIELLGDQTSYDVEGLQPGTSYTFKVEACDTEGNWSTNGPSLTVTTLDDQAPVWTDPELTALNVTETSLTLVWTAATDNVKVNTYEIYIDGILYDIVSGESTQTDITGFGPGSEYTFTVVAVDTAGNKSQSNPVLEVTTRDDDPPVWGSAELTAHDVTDNAVTLVWQDATDNTWVKSYKLYDAGTGELIDEIPFEEPCQYRVTGLLADTEYTFKVEAEDVMGNVSTDGPSVTVRTLAPDTEPPQWPQAALTPFNVKPDEVSLSWTAATDNMEVTGYQVFVDDQYLGTLSASIRKCKIINLDHGTQYTFKIEAVDGAGNASQNGPSVQVRTGSLAPDGVPNLQVAVGVEKVTLSWTTVINAAGYTVKYGTQPGTYDITIDAGNVTSLVIPGLEYGTTYYFVVAAYNQYGVSDDSNEVNAEPLSPDTKPLTLSVDTSGTGVTVYSYSVTATEGIDPEDQYNGDYYVVIQAYHMDEPALTYAQKFSTENHASNCMFKLGSGTRVKLMVVTRFDESEGDVVVLADAVEIQ